MSNNCLSVLYKHIIQVENKNVGLKVCVCVCVWGGGGTNTIPPPIKKVWGGDSCPPCPPLPTPVKYTTDETVEFKLSNSDTDWSPVASQRNCRRPSAHSEEACTICISNTINLETLKHLQELKRVIKDDILFFVV